ncbi:MAG: DUF4038 domain-containing protein [Planctomycetes bacterium]|nr:DUF4038 domain-containing protein [Planctomycetota bacterium]
MKRLQILLLVLLVSVGPGIIEVEAGKTKPVYPRKQWVARRPHEVGLDARKLKALSDYAGGFGCVVRNGYMVYTWGDASRRKDVASAVKPLYTHFLLKAVEQGKLKSIDESVAKIEPKLNSLNKSMDLKDRKITWRHLCNQISCYGVREQPGQAFDYSDYNMALFFDTLFLKVYGSAWKTVDDDVLHPELNNVLQCQDNPTFMAFGTGNRPGRLAISPRDFARFGLLYLRKGKWKGKQLISAEHASMAVATPLPTSIPRTKGKSAEMIRGQRSIGGGNNQCDHNGSYSYAWWINGVGRDGKRNWPDVPADVYGCFGHGDIRAMVVMPSLDLIVSWNDTKILENKMVNQALKLLVGAANSNPKNPSSKRSKSGGGDFGNKTGFMWKCLEWSVDRVSGSGNLFDVMATVTFTHSDSGEKRITEMFYDTDKTWKFRFTGTRTGKWTFATKSEVPDLDGRSGTVTIKPNPNPNIKGFLTTQGNKFAIQVGNEGKLKAYRFNAYMNGNRFPRWESFETFGDRKMVLAYLDDARKHGFDTIFVHVNNNWFNLGTPKYTDHKSQNPDPKTFEILEKVIATAGEQGCRVHIWAWGDEARKWTPIGVGGKNGEPDKRLQRYIAARLDPLPGWTMGYGFDLQEWTNEEDLRQWAKYLHKHMGWRHLLCGRGRANTELDVISYSNYDVRKYEQIRKDLNSDRKRPHLYEERHTYLRNGDLSMDGTRRFLWKLTMAGGMGCFWGFYPKSKYPYPKPQQLRCASEFWKGRFLLDMLPDNSLTDGYCLKTSDRKHYVFYKEDADSIRLDLSKLAGKGEAVAVDAKKAYQETKVGALISKKHVWKAPYVSDWGIAVGNFGSDERTRLTGNPVRKSKARRGQVIVDPEHPQWLKRKGGGPFFMCGPGDPEDFLYRGKLNPDGNRNGDQMELIGKLKGTGANCIYLMGVRSHGGDGDKTHNPFVNNDPVKGINAKVLEQWEVWFKEMDKNGIVIYFFFYDDSSRIWKTGDKVGTEEKDFIRAIVDRFEHHKNLIWCIAEEYQEAFSAKRVKNIAAQIRAADDYGHVIAVHKLSGLDFSEFADEPNIDQFAIQYNMPTPDALHNGMVSTFKSAQGKYNLNMSEAADYGVGEKARKKSWACAMGGAYVMILGMDIAATTESDLRDCGRLVRFFESTNFNEMSPHDELRYGGTKYVLALPGTSYIAYTPNLRGKIGLRGMSAGNYEFRWFDCATGQRVLQTKVTVAAGDKTWSKPAGIGNELAVYIRRIVE